MTLYVAAATASARPAAAVTPEHVHLRPARCSWSWAAQLPEVTVAYETYGRLNAGRDNAVLICHALSGDSHVARHDARRRSRLVGHCSSARARRSTPTATSSICPNILGGCRGTTGPNSINPATGRPYGTDFPVITVGDMVEVQRRLIDHLGIERLLARRRRIAGRAHGAGLGHAVSRARGRRGGRGHLAPG